MLKELFKKGLTYIKRFFELYEEMYVSKFRGTIYREYMTQQDLFMILCFSDLLGIPNPVYFYTLELYPEFYKYFHEWHIRMGMEKSPIDGLGCC